MSWCSLGLSNSPCICGSTRTDIQSPSCGFDASEHEHASMSRHGRRVPATFYRRFATDARAFANQVARGRLISVLEGGYSDRALTSGAMAHAAGLVLDNQVAEDDWWTVENLMTVSFGNMC